VEAIMAVEAATVEGHDWCPACECLLPLEAFKRDRRKAACCVLNCWECRNACADRRAKERMRRYYDGTAVASRTYRDFVFSHYGWSCQCCGTTNQPTIDHLSGDGLQHRETVKGARNIYRWLVENGYPEGFQTLCLNCNASKRAGPRCLLDHSEPGSPRRRTPTELRRLRTAA
jgi:hypothetical protein